MRGRIEDLLPSASGAEILWALGLADSVIGVSDLCDYPQEVLNTKPVVSRSRVDPAVMSSEEVEAALRDILAKGENPYELDYEWLARELPDIIFTQDLCHICEIDAGEVNQAVRGIVRTAESRCTPTKNIRRHPGLHHRGRRGLRCARPCVATGRWPATQGGGGDLEAEIHHRSSVGILA